MFDVNDLLDKKKRKEFEKNKKEKPDNKNPYTQKETNFQVPKESSLSPGSNYEDDKINEAEIETVKKLSVKGNINLFVLLIYLLKLQLFDKSVMMLSFASMAISLVWGILLGTIGSNDDEIYIMFQWYFIVSALVLNFIIVMKIQTFFYNSKVEDKTLYITIVQQISRVKLFFSIAITSVLIAVLTILADLFIIFILFSIISTSFNMYVFNMLIVVFFYVFLTSIFLANFFSLCFLILKQQIVLIISSFIIAGFFVSSLPETNYKKNELSTKLNFTGGYTPFITDVYQTFDINNMVQTGNIKYKYLSKYIYNNFFEKGISDVNLGLTSSINARKNLWKDLGIVNESPKFYPIKNAKLIKKPQSLPWQLGDLIDVNINLAFRFESLESLGLRTSKVVENEDDFNNFLAFDWENGSFVNPGVLSENEKLLIIKDLYDFTNYFMGTFSDETQFYSTYSHLFKDLVTLDTSQPYCDTTNSDMEKCNNTAYNPIGPYYLPFTNSYVSSLFTGFYSGTGDFVLDNNNESVKKFIEDVKDPLFLTTSIIDSYMSLYSSNFSIYTTTTPVSSSWNEYNNIANMRFFTNIFNVFSNVVTNFTYYAPKSYKDMWFEPTSNPIINLAKQDNLFLSYNIFRLKLTEDGLIDPTSSSNYVEPYIFLIVQCLISLGTYLWALSLFIKKDFK